MHALYTATVTTKKLQANKGSGKLDLCYTLPTSVLKKRTCEKSTSFLWGGGCISLPVKLVLLAMLVPLLLLKLMCLLLNNNKKNQVGKLLNYYLFKLLLTPIKTP